MRIRILLLEGTSRRREGKSSICNLALSKGKCQASLRRFHYDPLDGTCKLFVFGGCQGNANNFETMTQCIEVCIGEEATLPTANALPRIETTTIKQNTQAAGWCTYRRLFFNTGRR